MARENGGLSGMVSRLARLWRCVVEGEMIPDSVCALGVSIRFSARLCVSTSVPIENHVSNPSRGSTGASWEAPTDLVR